MPRIRHAANGVLVFAISSKQSPYEKAHDEKECRGSRSNHGSYSTADYLMPLLRTAEGILTGV